MYLTDDEWHVYAGVGAGDWHDCVVSPSNLNMYDVGIWCSDTTVVNSAGTY